MHIKYLFLPLLLTYFGQTYPVICQATVLKHEQKNKTVLLLGDMHASVAKSMKSLGCKDETIASFESVGQEQQAIFTDFIKNLLHVAHKKPCIITETNASTAAALFEQEAGFIESEPDREILCFIPRLILQELMKDGNTPEEKAVLFNTNVAAQKNQQYLNGRASVVLKNNSAWIIGDTLRTPQDFMISQVIYQYRSNIIEALKQQDPSLPEDIKTLTIGFVKEYIISLQTLFLNNELNDVYSQSITDTINDVTSKSGLSDSDHFALLYQYLVDNNATDEMDNLNNKLINCISQVFDLELQYHIEAITESGDECDKVIVAAGVAHAQFVRDYLLTKGYTMVHQVGIEYTDDNDLLQPSYYDHIVQQAATLNNNFDAVAQSILV